MAVAREHAESVRGATAPTAARDGAIDRLRGFVMLLMALDHARDFFGDGRRDPTDLATTTPMLFATRWITHYCAPVFVFLAGTAAYLSYARHGSKKEIAKFLASRGAFLVLLELTVIRVGWFFDLTWRFTALQVIWAIGCSMLFLALLVALPSRLVGAFGVFVIATHNTLDHFDAKSLGMPRFLHSVLHAHGLFEPFAGKKVFVVYPLVPWIGVIAAGWAFGEIMRKSPDERRRTVVGLGAAITAGFVALRALNMYGDPHRWLHQDSLAKNVMAFLNLEKYPPSLDYLAMTLGPALLLLVAFERANGAGGRVLELFGRVPLFYYILHLYLLHAAAGLVAYVAFGSQIFGRAFFEGGGVRASLPWIYVAWAIAIALLYPMCRWYDALKRRRRDVWILRYL